MKNKLLIFLLLISTSAFAQNRMYNLTTQFDSVKVRKLIMTSIATGSVTDSLLAKKPNGGMFKVAASSYIYSSPYNPGPAQQVASSITFSGLTSINNRLTVASLTSLAGLRTSLVDRSASYTLDLVGEHVINATGTFTITVPSGTLVTGQEYIIKNNGTGVITLALTGGQTLDGASSYFVNAGESVTIAALGSAGWTKISNLTVGGTSNVRGGRYFASGNGVTLSYAIPHNKTGVTSATAVQVTAMNSASGGFTSVTLTSTDVTIVFPVAPASGTNNLEFSVTLLN